MAIERAGGYTRPRRYYAAVTVKGTADWQRKANSGLLAPHPNGSSIFEFGRHVYPFEELCSSVGGRVKVASHASLSCQ